MATAPEKTPTEKVKFSEVRAHHQSTPRQKLPKKEKIFKKVATPYLHSASVIRPRPDALTFKRHFAIE